MKKQIIFNHMTRSGERCRIISQDRDRCIIEIEDINGWWVYSMRRLTPIEKKV